MPDYERQHLVSQVLLRRFVGADGAVRVFDLRDQREFATGPAVLGAMSNFISFDAPASEETWSQIEGTLPHLIEMIEAGVHPSDPDLGRLAKDVFALHWARSHTMRLIWETSIPENLNRRQLEMLNDPQLPDVFRDLTGLEPVGIGAREYAAESIRRRLEEEFGTGEFFRERVHANLDEARARLEPLGVEVTVLSDGEFMLGDNPALTVRKDHRGVGPLGGVPWGDADTVVLPLGPFVSLSFGSESAIIDGDARYAEILNVVQARGAIRHLFFRPESGLGAGLRRAFDEASG